MSYFSRYFLVATAIAMSTTDCAASGTSDTSGSSPAVELSHEKLNSPPGAVPAAPVPEIAQGTEELGPPPAAVPIDPERLKSALGDQAIVAKLRDLGLQVAANAGVPAPTAIRAVAASDHQDVETILSGAFINDHAPVYVLIVTGGRFTTTDHPPEVPAPEGQVLTVTVDAATYRVTDIGIVKVEPDLSKIALTSVDLGAK